MNYKKELYNIKPKGQLWRLCLLWLFIATIGIINSSCDKGNEEVDVDEYYVKYEINSEHIQSGYQLYVTFRTEKESNITVTIDVNTQWEEIIGPVQKGFSSMVKAKAVSDTGDKLKLYAKLYVSKNDSPFAIKEIDGSDTPRDNVQINYTIDY